MATALRKQLAAIASSSSNELDLKAQKAAHSKSLLFNEDVAGSQSFDLLWQICAAGFEELRALDSRFNKFSQSIFSVQSMTEDRALMTARDNKELDGIIESFLLLVGSRLLLQPALKAVEWLVRRFRIHELNTGATILTFLPYHNTNLFTSLLSILPQKLPPSFKFLHTYMHSVSNPPATVLVYEASHNPGFFSALNQYVLAAGQARCHHTALLSLWASTAGQTVNERLSSSKSGRHNIQRGREDDFLTDFLPVLNEALALRKASELVLASYMITVILIAKADLGEHVLDAFLQAVVLSWNADTFEAGLACAAAIAERKYTPQFSAKTVRTALRHRQIGAKLAALAPHQKVDALVIGLLKGAAVHPKLDPDFELGLFVEPLLKQSKIEEATRATFARLAIAASPDVEVARKALEAASFSEDRVTSSALERKQITSTSSTRSESEDDEMVTDLPPFEPSSLPSTLATNTFLSQDASQAFEAFSVSFSRALRSSDQLESFFNLPVWRKQGKLDNKLYISFLARSWSSHLPMKTRKDAMDLFHQHLKSSPSLQATDLLPYVLCALADETRPVRKAAAGALLGMVKNLQQSTSGTPEEIKVYSADSASVLLSGKTYGSFLDGHIKPQLEECQTDRRHVRSALGQILGAKSTSEDQEGRAGKKFKSSQRAEVFGFLSSHIQNTPVALVKLRLLSFCNSVSKVGGQPRSVYLIDCLKGWLSSRASFVRVCELESLSISQLDSAMLEIVHHSDPASMALLLSVIRGDVTVDISFRQLSIARLQALWSSLSQISRTDFAREMIDLCTADPELSGSELSASSANELLRSVSLAPETLVELLSHSCNAVESMAHGSAKKRRMNSGKASQTIERASTDEIRNMARLGLALELTDSSDAVADVRLFHALFHALRILQDYRHRTSNDVDFLCHLTLANLLSICRTFDASSSPPQLDRTIVRNELVVELIRKTSSSQVRNHGILVLSSLAKFMPDAVLQSVIPVFTLLGASTARQTDEFSVHVVDQTIREVVPLLVNPLRENKEEYVGAMANILASFAAAFLHVPPSRRQKMFSLLASSLGPSESLCPILAALVDQHPSNGGVTIFCAQLLQQFTTNDALAAILQYMELIASISSGEENPARQVLRKLESQEDQEETMRGLLAAAPVLLREGITPARILADMQNLKTAQSLQHIFGRLLVVENALNNSARIKSQPQLRNGSTKSLENTLKLLPFKDFIKSIEPLVATSSDEVSRSILKSFEGQLRTNAQLDKHSRLAATSFLPVLTNILQRATPSPLQLNAVVCVDLICEKVGKLDTDAVQHAAAVIVSPACMASKNPLMHALSLHCLSTIVEVLEDEYIPLLKQSFEAIDNALGSSTSTDSQDKKLHSGALSLATTIIDHLAYMVPSEVLQQLLVRLFESATSSLAGEVKENRGQFIQAVSSKVNIHVVFEVLQKTWIAAVKRGPRATRDAVRLLSASLAATPKSTAAKRTHLLLEPFLTFLDLRHLIVSEQLSGIYPEEQVAGLEGSVVDSMMALVLKINDAAFRPFFDHLLEWADDLPKSAETGKILRWTALFNLLAALSERLKSLVTSYFANVVEVIVTILNNSAESPPTSASSKQTPQQSHKQMLVTSALTALTSSLRHDATDFYATPARFAELHPALLAPLPMQNPTPPTSLAQTHLIPALVALAGAVTANQTHLVTLQTAMLDRLLKYNVLRPDSSAATQARGRLAGVMAMRAIGQQVGEEWLAELPRMLPVISELLEDDDERIERETGAWVQEMEGVLGENVGDMLT